MAGLMEVKVVGRTEWASDLITLTVDHAPSFEPGQFFNLGLRDGEGNIVRRSYSAASAPDAPLQFVISKVNEGTLTPSLFALADDAPLWLDTTPLGFFTLKEVPECKTLWLVATGTGLGPFISMLRSGALAGRFEKIVIVHGVRHASSLCYRTELEQSAEQAAISYVPVLSGDDTDGSALFGRITAVWDSGALELRAGAFDSDSHMLMCGNPQMIDDMCERLKARGYEKHRRRKPGHFNYERYW